MPETKSDKQYDLEKFVYTLADLSDMGFGTVPLLRKRARKGVLPAYLDGGRYLVLRDDLLEFIARRKAETFERLADHCGEVDE